MSVFYCPECGSNDQLKRHRCGWKFTCEGCKSTFAILNMTRRRGGILALFDCVTDIDDAAAETKAGLNGKASDKGVS